MLLNYKRQLIIPLIVCNILLQIGSISLVKIASIDAAHWFDVFFCIPYFSALVLLCVRAVLWQSLLNQVDLSVVYPFNAVVPLFIFTIGVVFFREPFYLNHVFGIALIILGLLFVIEKNKRPCSLL